MRVLVVGGGGREHALAWGLARSPRVPELHAAPGNAGISALAACHSVDADDLDGIVALADSLRPDLVVIGPEAPLVAGLADALRAGGFATFGPGADAARLEGSKTFAKEVMARGKIPTAASGTFTSLDEAVAFVDELGGRAVVKADGLAAGKGVTVAVDRDRAVAALRTLLAGGALGAPDARVVVEEVLEGPEVSAFALADGETVMPFALAQDFKRVGKGDTGPNTGGMGAYSPLPWVGQPLEEEIWDLCRRTIATLAADGVIYRGLLYTGLMLTPDGPKVLEYNCRFGDPETEVVIPRLRSDLAELLLAASTGRLADVGAEWSPDAAVTVILASGGYPGPYRTGVPIDGLDEASEIEGATVFHAGTSGSNGRVVTSGGRVLSVTGVGDTIGSARDRAYGAVSRIRFDGAIHRTDIAARAAEGE